MRRSRTVYDPFLNKRTETMFRKEKPPKTDVWNSMIWIRDNTTDPDVKKDADRLLGQYNTAGGRRIKPELENFIARHY